MRADKPRVLASVAALCRGAPHPRLAAGGPVFASQGLISPRLSRSASVVVDIASLEELARSCCGAGWTVPPPVKRVAVLPSVVLALENSEWVVDLTSIPRFPVSMSIRGGHSPSCGRGARC